MAVEMSTRFWSACCCLMAWSSDRRSSISCCCLLVMVDHVLSIVDADTESSLPWDRVSWSVSGLDSGFADGVLEVGVVATEVTSSDFLFSLVLAFLGLLLVC